MGVILDLYLMITLYVRFGKLLTKRAVSFNVKDKYKTPSVQRKDKMNV